MKTLTRLGILCALSALPAFAAPEKSELTGKVTLAPALQKKISPNAVLYIIARPDGQTAGPPAAVKRIPQPLRFPLGFSITAADSMMGGDKLEGRFLLTARISQSGSAMPASAGDLQSKTAVNGVTAGGAPVTLTIDEVRN